jgi:hypothetical protein
VLVQLLGVGLIAAGAGLVALWIGLVVAGVGLLGAGTLAELGALERH